MNNNLTNEETEYLKVVAQVIAARLNNKALEQKQETGKIDEAYIITFTDIAKIMLETEWEKQEKKKKNK